MEPPLHNNFRDILAIPAQALSAKRILVMTFFLCVGLLVYDLFTYAALTIDGKSLEAYWALYGFLPLAWFKLSSFAAGALYGVGITLGILTVMLGLFGVSVIEIEQIRGNRFLSAFGAIKFSFQRLGQLFVSEISFAATLVVIAGFVLLLGLVTRIPFVGEWVFALTFLIPGFMVALLSILIVFVWILSIVLLPAVAASEQKKEAFNAILMTFSTVIRQPVRWLVYTAYGVVIAKLASFVYAYICFLAVYLFTWCASLSAGNKATNLVRAGLSHLPGNSDFVRETFQVFPGVDWSFSISRWMRSGSDDAVGYIMALMLFFIFASIVGYFLAIIATGQARSYAVIRFINDEYIIADEDPLFFVEEHVNEPT
ncbi:MAG: hypothetical protein DRP47_03165 [Candidatus Zixiibacteriota bacterium]|nr:MAG: hypothetical protein DRP47_03165 [candidate division Zixibacteria bacterium]